MSDQLNQIFQEAEDDEQAIQYIRQHLPQELKEKFTDELLYYFLDVLIEYYGESGILDADPDEMTMYTKIAEDLEADRLDVVELLMSIEDEFEVEIPDEEIENLKTIGDVVEYIQNNM